METGYDLNGINHDTRCRFHHAFADVERAQFWFDEYRRMSQRFGAPMTLTLTRTHRGQQTEAVARWSSLEG